MARIELLTTGTGLSKTEATETFARSPRTVPMPVQQAQQFNPQSATVSVKPVAIVDSVTLSTSYTDVDPDLHASIVCPPSGRIKFRLKGAGMTGAASVQLRWVLAVDGGTVMDTEHAAALGTASGGAPLQQVSTEGILRTDTSGNPLVPGKTYTVTWRQRSSVQGNSARTQYGGSLGAAVMELIPVVDRVTTGQYDATVTQPGWVPLWLCKDNTLLGQPGVGAYLAYSTDDGATWTNHGHLFKDSVQHVRDMDNGELVVFTEAWVNGESNCAIWVSSGWPADKATATFTRTHEAVTQSGTSPIPSDERKAWRAWSIDTYGPIVLAAEYGPKISTDKMARYVYLSEDYGQTWRVIFDLADHAPTGVEAHLHGVAYDPWWDAIWLSNGDGPDNAANWLSLDRGKTWRRLEFAHQCTTIYPMAECVIFLSDSGSPNGIFRIPRTHPDAPMPGEAAFVLDETGGLTMYGNQAFRLRGQPGAAVLLSHQTGNVSGPGRLFATDDGYTLREVWRDEGQSYVSRGLMTAVGPTSAGTIHGRLDRTSSFSGDAHYLRLTPRT